MTDEEIICQHSDLMPELADALEKHRLIQSAREQAKLENDDGRVTFGDYVLLEPLGRGGMGVVYRANQFSLNRDVAIKMIRDRSPTDEQRVRFRKEAEAAAALKHPNIVPVYEVGEFKGDPYFSMEFVEGVSLTQIVTSRSWSQKQVAECVAKVAEAIHYAHERGFLHRDIKPANVLLDAHGQPRITDFGLAKRIDDNSDLTKTKQVLGSPNYMSPEQACGDQARIGYQSDIYSLGALLYALLSGVAPFNESSVEDILRKVKEEPAAPLRDLVPGLDRRLQLICQRCMEKEPEKRYPNAKSLADDLNRYIANKRISRRGLRWGLRPLFGTVLATVGLIVTLFLYRYLSDAGSNPEPFVVVTVPYPGASAEQVASAVASPIEKTLLGMDGITHVVSRCTEGMASVSVFLDPAVPSDKTIASSIAAVDTIPNFPDLAESPEWTAALSSRRAIAWLVFRVGKQAAESDLTDKMKAVERARGILSRLPEVGMVQAVGVPLHRIEVLLDPGRLQQFGRTADDIGKLIRGHHRATVLGGSVEPVETTDSLHDLPDRLKGLPILESDGSTIFLREVATVSKRVSMSASLYEQRTASATATGKVAGAPFHVVLLGIWPAAGYEHSDVVSAVVHQLSDVSNGWQDGHQEENGFSVVNLTAKHGFHLDLYTPDDAPADYLPTCVDVLARSIRSIVGVEQVICMDESTSLHGLSDSELIVVTSSEDPEISESISSAIRELQPLTVRVDEIRNPLQNFAGIEINLLGPGRESVWRWGRSTSDNLQSQTEIRNLMIDGMREQTVLQIVESTDGALLGVPLEQIAKRIRMAAGWLDEFPVRTENGTQDVLISIRLDKTRWEPNAAIPDDLEVVLPSGDSVKLGSNVVVEWSRSPRDLMRYDGLAMVRITAEYSPELSSEGAKSRLLDAAETARKEIGLSTEFRIVD